MNTASYPSEVQTWPEAATIVVSCLLGVLAALMAVLVLSDEGAPSAPSAVEVADGPNGSWDAHPGEAWAEVHPGNLLNV